jgi:hypothetical protein
MRTVLTEKLITTESTLVEFVIFNHEKRQMKVKYLRGKHEGKVRTYNNIPPEAFKNITEAKSKGKQVLKTIAKYRQEKSSFFTSFKNWFNSNLKSPY